jgi:hypothetical protein
VTVAFNELRNLLIISRGSKDLVPLLFNLLPVHFMLNRSRDYGPFAVEAAWSERRELGRFTEAYGFYRGVSF